MQIHEMEDEALVKEYRDLRKQTKHDKRGRGMAASTELKRAKIRCLCLKDEIDRRGIDADSFATYESIKSTSRPLQSPRLTVVAKN